MDLIKRSCHNRFAYPDATALFWSYGKIGFHHGEDQEAMRAVAKKWDAPLIDQTKMTTPLYESWGDRVSKQAVVQYPVYKRDHTHTSARGAVRAAEIIVKGIRRTDNQLKEYVLDSPKIALPRKKTFF